MADYLKIIAQGTLINEVNEKLTEIVEACESTFAQGSVILKIKVKGHGAGNKIEIQPTIKAKIPVKSNKIGE